MHKNKLKTPSKALLVLATAILLVAIALITLVFYQDYLERDCKKLFASTVDYVPETLVDISLEEKKELEIDAGLAPTKRFYEYKKCIKDKGVF